MENNHICPWWMGYFLINPLRRFSDNPEKMFQPYLKPGMTVIDYGCAMGYFSIPLARMVGPSGKVHCFDIQDKMLKKLNERTRKRNLQKIISSHLIQRNNETDFKRLEQSADFALLFAVAHEVPDQKKLFKTIHRMLKAGSLLYFAEPPLHVKPEDFNQSVSYAEQAGFILEKSIMNSKSHSVLLRKTTPDLED